MSVILSELERKTIEELTSLVGDKKILVAQLAVKYEKAPMTISNHWLNGFYSVPKSLAEAVRADIVEFITNENTDKQ